MKKFRDLEFELHPAGFGSQAIIHFENGYGVSVVSGEIYYASEDNPYEVAVLKNGRLCYDTEITDDVIGYCDRYDVENIMEKVQKLEKPKSYNTNRFESFVKSEETTYKTACKSAIEKEGKIPIEITIKIGKIEFTYKLETDIETIKNGYDIEPYTVKLKTWEG